MTSQRSTEERVINEDCIKWLRSAPAEQADLIFADPPFNIGYKYDVYEDKKKYDKYLGWTKSWIKAAVNYLKPNGSFWIAIGDEYAAEVRQIGRDENLTLRNWVIWYYTFGQSTRMKFARSHTHLFYFVKNPSEFTFNDASVRTFSDRQRRYKDKRANSEGKIPDDVWTEFPRVCGTFGERTRWHPCQMPEVVLARIIRTCSNLNDLVYDPFAGSGTTLVVSKKLGRRYIGTELSPKYCRKIRERLERTTPLSKAVEAQPGKWPKEHLEVLQSTYLEAGVPTDDLIDPKMLYLFSRLFSARMEASDSISSYDPADILRQLFKLRKAGKLGTIRVHARETRESTADLPFS